MFSCFSLIFHAGLHTLQMIVSKKYLNNWNKKLLAFHCLIVDKYMFISEIGIITISIDTISVDHRMSSYY